MLGWAISLADTAQYCTCDSEFHSPSLVPALAPPCLDERCDSSREQSDFVDPWRTGRHPPRSEPSTCPHGPRPPHALAGCSCLGSCPPPPPDRSIAPLRRSCRWRLRASSPCMPANIKPCRKKRSCKNESVWCSELCVENCCTRPFSA